MEGLIFGILRYVNMYLINFGFSSIELGANFIVVLKI